MPVNRSCAPFREGRVSGLRWCCWSDEDDSHISSSILQGVEPPMEVEPLTYWKSLLRSSAAGLVIDGGAQVGLFTATAISLGHNVLAVDTRPEHVQMILSSLKINRLEAKAMVVHAALGDECGRTVTIRQPVAANPGSSQVVEQRRLSLSRSLETPSTLRQKQFNERGVALPMLTLDSLLTALQRHQLNATELPRVHAVKLE